MELGFIKKLILHRLLEKESPDSYMTSLPEKEQIKYDYAYVQGSTEDHMDALICSWNEPEDIIQYMWWPEGAQAVRGTDATCKFSELKWETLNVRHRFRTWDIRYGTLSEAFWHDLLRLPLLKWWFQKLRNSLLRPINPDHRMDLLKLIVDLHSKQKPMTAHDLLAKIHGSALRLSNDYGRHQKDLEFLLESLKDSGDLIYKDENDAIHSLGHGKIAPTPKSVSTISVFNEDLRRHKDMVKMSGRQLWLGWAMFAIAAVTLFVELRKWRN